VKSTASPGHESFTLPLVFLSVAFAGGFRLAPGGRAMSFAPPALMTFVLAVMLLGIMVRAGLLVPASLVGDRRAPLENLSGGVVLLSLLAASAQVFNCLTPDVGFFRLMFDLFFFFLLWTTLAAQPDRPRLLRSLFVVFGWAFVTRYVILDALYDPAGGWARKVVTALLEGATVGSIAYQPQAPAGGYVAFATLGLYMIGLVLLPATRPEGEALAVRPSSALAD
jgi:hypothetical protein